MQQVHQIKKDLKVREVSADIFQLPFDNDLDKLTQMQLYNDEDFQSVKIKKRMQ